MLGVSIVLQKDGHRGPIRATTASYSIFVSAQAVGNLLLCTPLLWNSDISSFFGLYHMGCSFIPTWSAVFTIGGACAATVDSVSCHNVRHECPSKFSKLNLLTP